MNAPLAGSRANVRSLEALRLFRPVVIQFETELRNVFGALHREVDRTLEWLDHDCPRHWRQQVRKSFDDLAKARSELARKQMITVAGHRPECIDEKNALRDARRRLEQAQKMIHTVSSWSIKAHRAADEYNGQIGRIEQDLSQSIPQLCAVLDRIIAALHSYVAQESPLSTLPEAGDEAIFGDGGSPSSGSTPSEERRL